MVEAAQGLQENPLGEDEVPVVVVQKPVILEKRVLYRHGLTAAVAKPPPGAVMLTRVRKVKKGGEGKGKKGVKVKENDPTRPQEGTELCDETMVDELMEWKIVKGADTGFRNTSVTCYINATLQALTFTAPLANYLALYKTNHRGAGVDWLSMVSAVTRFSTTPPKPRSVHNPVDFNKHLRRLSTSLRRGRLEDAQEFLNFLLDACHMYQLSRYGDAKDPLVQETTPIKTIFGGFFKSCIQWSKAEEVAELKKKSSKTKKPVPQEVLDTVPQSATYEPFSFLTLEIHGGTVEKSLQHFAKPEQLTGDNKYITPSGVKVDAQKSFTVYRSPRILIVHLKRFLANMWGDTKKVNKYTEFAVDLDMRPYMSGPEPHSYKLYSIVVHQGGGTESGHYISFVTAPNGLWYRMDDEDVTQVSLNVVLKQQAYLLFYKRVTKTAKPVVKPSPAPATLQKDAAATNGVSARQRKFENRRKKVEQQEAEEAAKKEAEQAAALKKQEEQETEERHRLHQEKMAAQQEAKKERMRKKREEREKVKKRRAEGEEKTVKRRKVAFEEPREEEEKQVVVVEPEQQEQQQQQQPVKKKKKKIIKKKVVSKKYESAALNAQSAFEMPKDTEAYWEESLKEDRLMTARIAELDDETGVVVDEATQKFGEELQAAAPIVEKEVKMKKRKREDLPDETPLEKAKKEVAPIRAKAALEAKSMASTTTWQTVDQSARNKLLRTGKQTVKTAKQIGDEEWNKSIDKGKVKKLAKSQRISKGHTAGHTTFQQGFEKKQADDEKEKHEKATGTWEPTERSERSLKKLNQKKKGEEYFN